MTTLVVVFGILVTLGSIAWFVMDRNHPEDVASHAVGAQPAAPPRADGSPDSRAVDPAVGERDAGGGRPASG